MPTCPACGVDLVRVHRRAAEKLLFASVFRCRVCRRRVRRLHPAVRVPLQVLFSRHTRCIRCGSLDVERSPKRDPVEGLSASPVSFLMRLTGAPLNWCRACRLQYYDWRRAAGGRR